MSRGSKYKSYSRASRNLYGSVGKGKRAFSGATFGFFAAINALRKK